MHGPLNVKFRIFNIYGFSTATIVVRQLIVTSYVHCLSSCGLVVLLTPSNTASTVRNAKNGKGKDKSVPLEARGAQRVPGS